MPFCTLTLLYFCVSSVFDPVPNFAKQNPLVIDHYRFEFLRVQLKLKNLKGVAFLFESVAVVSSYLSYFLAYVTVFI